MITSSKSGVFARPGLRTRGDGMPIDSSATWTELVAKLAGDPDPVGSGAFWQLFHLAAAAAHQALYKRFRGVDESDIREATLDLMQRRLDRLVAASNPKGFVITCVRNRIIDMVRRPGRRLATKEQIEIAARSEGEVANDVAVILERRKRFEALDERSRFVLRADAEGHDRRDIADQLGVGRAAVDQIVVRARRKLVNE